MPNEAATPEEAKEAAPEQHSETDQQRCDEAVGEFVHKYYGSVSGSEAIPLSYIGSTITPQRRTCNVAIFYSNGYIDVRSTIFAPPPPDMGRDGDIGWEASFAPPHVPSSSDQRFWLREFHEQLDMTPMITCVLRGYNSYPCDSREDFDSAVLDLFGLDMSRAPIPIR